MECLSSGYYLIDPEYNVIHLNETAKRTYPALEVGKKCYACLMNLDEPCGPCPVVGGIKGARTYVDPIRGITETVDAVDVPIEGVGLCHALVFGTVGNDAEFAATLPTSAAELKDLALIKALTHDYLDVFSVNLTYGTISLYRHNGKPVDATNIYRENLKYEEGTRTYIDRYLYEEDVHKMLPYTDPEYVAFRLRKHESFDIDYRVLQDGEIHYYSRKYVRIGDADNFDHFVVGVTCVDDEVKSRLERQELRRNLNEVEIDSVTGLYTREAFGVHADRLLEENSDVEYDFCVLNVENLGMITHQYGQTARQKLLEVIGRLLKEYDTDEVCLGYLGNGVFASYTVSTSGIVRKSSISKFKDDIFEASDIKTLNLKWSLYRNVERNLAASEILDNTMYALSTIASNIHQDYVEFDNEMLHKMERDEEIKRTFDDVIARGELTAWYQPKYSVETGRIVGAEALVRWVKPDGEIISPGVFIPVIEECGKVGKLDAYVYDVVCRMQNRLHDAGIDNLPISVNLSRASMFINDLAGSYYDIASGHGVDVNKIPIEITESAAVRASAISSLADEMIARGFVLHMDDFGAGYSSLASLQVIPFEQIKIDRSLVAYIGRPESESLLRHVVEFAHETGKSVVAEGVETAEQFEYMKSIGCDYIQGYYFSKPVSEDEFIAMLG